MKKYFEALLGKVFLLIFVVNLPSSSLAKEETGDFVFKNYLPVQQRSISNEEINKISENLNKKLPMMVDQVTRFEKAMPLNQGLQYKYTLVSIPSKTINQDAIRPKLRKYILDSRCNDMKILLDAGISLEYAFYGNDGGFIVIVDVFEFSAFICQLSGNFR